MSRKNDPDDGSNGDKKQLGRIKSSVLSRSFSLARLGLGAGTQLAGRGIAQLWESKDQSDDRWKTFLSGQAAVFAREIGELKGSVMKAGQLLSMYGEHFFPPEVNQLLKSLQHDSPPLRWEAMREILERELGAEKMALLEIETTSLASASLGQVHKARIRATGETLALKIQYPGVEKAIDSDLRALKTILNLLQVLPKDLDTAPMFNEVRRMLVQETDYLQEADWTDSYGARLRDDDRFIVPRMHREFSNKHVLATSFEAGVRPDDPLVKALPQERRNRLAMNFLDLYFQELFEWRLVQTDPHAGNYRIRLRPDGRDQIVLLDFGATREYPESFMTPYRRMIAASVNDDREAFHRAALELRLLRETDDPKLMRLFEEFCFMIVEPFRGDVYDWKNTDLPQRTARMGLEIMRGFPLRAPPEEILFLDRKTGGVFIMMGLLGAKVRGRDALERHLSTSKLPSES